MDGMMLAVWVSAKENGERLSIMKVLQLISYYSPERVASSHLTEDREAAFAAADIELEIYVPTPTRGVSKEERDRYKQIKKEMKYDGKIVVHRFAM